MVWKKDSVGQRICRIRTERGLSQSELGQRTGLSEETVHRIETDVMDITRFREIAERISEALGVPESYVLHGMPHSEEETRAQLSAMVRAGQISQQEATDVLEMASVRLRSNAKLPLSQLEIETLLDVLRGGRLF